MRPFKMFFGLSLAVLLFFFVARFLIIAFIVATVLSIGYAIFRRVRDFITYDRFGEYYIQGYESAPGLPSNWNNESEPLFYVSKQRGYASNDNIQFIKIQ